MKLAKIHNQIIFIAIKRPNKSSAEYLIYRSAVELMFFLKPQATYHKRRKLWITKNTSYNITFLRDRGFKIQDFRAAPAPSAHLHIPLPAAAQSSLRPYQAEALQFGIQANGQFLIGDEMGTGKTVMSSRFVRMYNIKTLIVCPSSTKIQWQREFKKWAGRDAQILYGQTPRKLAKGNYIINWEILTYWKEELQRQNFGGVIGDEIQNTGNNASLRTSAFKKICKKNNVNKKIILLSGTPINSRPEQFFPCLNILRPQLFTSLSKFRNRYCAPESNGFGVSYKGSSNEKELNTLLKPFFLRRLKKDILKDLPPVIRSVVLVETSGDLQKYLQHEMSFFELNLTQKNTSLAMEQQFENLKNEIWALKSKGVVNWIANFLATSDEQLIIGAWHTEIIDTICKAFSAPRISGSVTGKKRELVISNFAKSKTQLLVVQMLAGGVGLDGLQKTCSNVATVEFAYTPTIHDQFEARLDRIGQTKAVNCYYLIADGTMETELMSLLDEKRKILSAVLDGTSISESSNMLLSLLQKRNNII